MDVLAFDSRRPANGRRKTTGLLLLAVWAAMPLHARAQLLDPPSQAETVDSKSGAEENAQPYIVFVSDKDAYARCGPGEQHYRTEALRRGQELEVYVETEEGWLGIRPLEESFCWLPADVVEMEASGSTARVIEDKTVAWIGTNLGQARKYRWQVQLSAGEQVAIVGHSERKSADGSKHWLRIVPPSGEFRWVHRDQIVESAEQLAAVIAEQSQSDHGLVAVSSQQAVADLVPIPAGEVTQASNKDSARDEASEMKSVLLPASQAASSENMLRTVDEMPELLPAPEATGTSSRRNKADRLADVPDKPFQLHRGVDPDDFEDRGAVIGSGLRTDWNEGSEDDRVAADDVRSGAAAAASAIAEPLRRVSDVVANFISPPRLVQIDPNQPNNVVAATDADRRWRVGSERTLPNAAGSNAANQIGPGTHRPESSVAALAEFPANPTVTTPPTSLAGSPPLAPTRLGFPVVQTGATAPSHTPAKRPGRVISVAQITRVEDAMVNADVDTVAYVLSQLIAEQASADEMDPLIRRIETLLQSGDVSRATRTRELFQRATSYRNLAARRDGGTMIRSNVAQVSATEQLRSLTPSVPSPPLSASQPVEVGPQKTPSGTATGYLVQVYSSRANSPPYALTDDTGLTIAYVTPYPGVNLRNHLNSRVEVTGQEKLLEGMSTPHLLVNEAIRR